MNLVEQRMDTQLKPPRVLILTVAFGEGHNAAARAAEEELLSRGCEVQVLDPCRLRYEPIYEATRSYYNFCVRVAPWLWGLTYAQADNSDWERKVCRWPLSATMAALAEQLKAWPPELVLCTYPIYCYMLDHFVGEPWYRAKHAALVTDAIEISRPWLRSAVPLICLPDAYSDQLMRQRYALPAERLAVTGFPTKRAFVPDESLLPPTNASLRVLYQAVAPAHELERELRALLAQYPCMQLSLLAGARYELLSQRLQALVTQYPGLHILPHTDQMPRLMREHHRFVGKAGAATMFEARASALPMLVNYSLPGQEQGNMELILRDGAGIALQGTPQLLAAIDHLLARKSRAWLAMRRRLLQLSQAQAVATSQPIDPLLLRLL